MKGKARGFLCGILILLSGLFSYHTQGIALLPEKQFVTVGEPLKLDFPVTLEKTIRAQISGNEANLNLKGGSKPNSVDRLSSLVSSEPGQFKVRLSLFGVIPVRDMLINVVPQVKVIPGGQSIGVLTQSQGVEVAGLCAVLDHFGSFVNPAADSGIKEGDIILTIEGKEVRSESQIRDYAARAGASGKPLAVEVKRGSETFTVKVNPVYSAENMCFQLGLLIKDSAAGIGTLTFYEPVSMVYGALGHLITETDTVRPVEMSNGKIVSANVQGIQKGKRGTPGEKIGIFLGDQQLNGTVARNTKLGIFGRLQMPVEGYGNCAPLPVASIGQIHEGYAEMLTVLKDDQVERFEIEIVKINLQAKNDGKGLIIKVTDQRLLDQAGGIIQGMSGSPIIQDNMLAGAVTHVFVNDPTRGYGVPAEWMIWEAEIIPSAVNALAC